MVRILIQKLKTAMKSSHPIEVVNEYINEYDEIMKSAEWRINTIKNGKNLKKNQKELDMVAKMLEKSGYYSVMEKNDISKKVREYFRNM